MKPAEPYSLLSQSEDSVSTETKLEDDEQLRPRRHDRARKFIYLLLGILSAMTCLVLGYMAHGNSSEQHIHHEHHDHHNNHSIAVDSPATVSELHCGNSSAEARALGCVFDLLTNNWMPQYCSDPHTDDEYRAWVLDPVRQLGAWAFYRDDQAQYQVASEEELSDLVGQHIWTTTENHLAHCAFLARRMHRLVTGEIAAVAHNTFAHTMHCTSAILKAVVAEQPIVPGIGSTFDVGIVSCLV
ncbi:hypothetical protein E8E14_011355 [Neopestalotiopsis sp. 37M]|nr:hypothetical protein E8E14_011355 [Neopestalotiopsis sp. 37M]